MQSNNSILNVFKNEFSSTIHNIHINSLGIDVKFRDVSVTEQKSTSKIIIENENRKDIIYDTQCALLNRLCIDKIPYEYEDKKTGEKETRYKNFDIYSLTEFDRVRIMMEIYQSNYFKDDVHYTCKECGVENIYHLDFSSIIQKLNEFDLKDIVCHLEDEKHIYNFTLNYPSVRNVSNFFKSYMRKYRNGVTQKQRDALDDLGNVEYIYLFIKSIELINKEDPENKKFADLTLMSYDEISELIDCFPQNIIFSEENGVLAYIAKELLQKINGVFAYEKCRNCGAETNQGIGSISDFF